jgi:hypothetical protein
MADKQAATAADKQNALAKCIAEATAKELAEEFKFLGDKLASLELQLKTVTAQIQMLDDAKPADGPKRGIRTTGGAKKGGTNKAAANSPDAKVSNALLYFRRAMQEDWNNYREVYVTTDNQKDADADPTVAKQDINKDEGLYYSAVGNYLWKTVLTDENKDEVREHFKTWKDELKRSETDAQLEEEVV